jgi:hypothetical protein
MPPYEPKPAVNLTDEQKDYIKKHATAKDLKDIAFDLFGRRLDTRSKEGQAIKEYIASLANTGVQVVGKENYNPVPPTFELSNEQKLLIKNNADSVSNPQEMANLVFGRLIHDSSIEYAAVVSFMQNLRPDLVNEDDELADEKFFRPPNSIQQLLGWANKYIPTGDPDKTTYGTKGLKKVEESNLRTLLARIRTQRFMYQASKFKKRKDRELFISTFIRFCHDKPDLSEEEVDQYIMAAAETVNIAQIEQFIRKIKDIVDENLQSSDDTKKGLSLKFLELVSANESKLDVAKGRLNTLIKNLTGSRSDRIKNQTAKNQSVIPLILLWKDEESRNRIILMGKAEHEQDEAEYEKLKSVDDIHALVCGLTRNEAKLGL